MPHFFLGLNVISIFQHTKDLFFLDFIIPFERVHFSKLYDEKLVLVNLCTTTFFHAIKVNKQEEQHKSVNFVVRYIWVTLVWKKMMLHDDDTTNFMNRKGYATVYYFPTPFMFK